MLLGLGSAVSAGAVGNSRDSTAMEGARGLMGVAGKLWLAYQEKTEEAGVSMAWTETDMMNDKGH